MASCSKCGSPAVTFIRYSGQRLCRDHFLHFFERRAKLAVAKQGRLPHGTIAVALSGGKDSVAALHFLDKVARENPRVDLVAISVDEGIAGYRQGALDICKTVTRERGIPWHTVTVRELAGYDIDEYAAGGGKDPTGEPRPPQGPAGLGQADRPQASGRPPQGPAGLGQADGPQASGRPPQGPAGLGQADRPQASGRPSCGPCGVFRRMGMNKLARELGAVALATGHNLDDMAQTILMNVLNGDLARLARLAPHDEPKPGLVPRLLPFRNIPEKEVLLYGLLEGLPIHDEAECPYAARANRFRMRNVVLGLEADQPGTRHSLLQFHDRVRESVPAGVGGDVGVCSACGEPTSGAVCKTCAWKL